MFDLDRFLIRRKVFRIFGAGFHVYDPTGSLVAYIHQKAFRLKEDIRVYTDESCRTELLSIKARQVIDFSSAYDIVDGAENRKVGAARRKGWSSFVRDSWQVLDANDQPVAKIHEDSVALALLRRLLLSLIPQTLEVHGLDGRSYATLRQRFNPLVFKLDVQVARDCPIDRRLLLGCAILIAAIEGRQN